MSKIEYISCVIIAKDAEKTIIETLKSLEEFHEVILYLNNSSDNTKKIAQSFKNVKIVEGKFLGFGPTKNKACAYASNDWILSLDSDEVLVQKNIDEISALVLKNNTLYKIKRDNYYNKKLIRCCGWENDKVIRLFNKTQTAFCDNLVHEYILKKNLHVMELKTPIKHYPYENSVQLIQKMQNYSNLFAQNQQGKKSSSTLKAFAKASFTFFKSYILQKGFLCGSEGLLISITNANTTFYKYIKLAELNKKN